MRHPPSSAALRRPRARIAGVGLAVLGLAAAAAVSPPAPARPASFRPAGASRWSDTAIATLPAALRRVLADAAWIRAVQYYGDRRLDGSPDFPDLPVLVEDALRLDPGFRPAAVTGALLVAEPRPFGAGLPGRAELLLQDWTARNPRDFEAWLVRALLHHWHLDDPRRAAHVLEAANVRGDAPSWMVALAARSFTEGGSREAARDLWRTLRSRASDARARWNANTHLLQLEALDERDRLSRVVRDFERGHGRRARGWDELIRAGFLAEAPTDPAGFAFELDGDGLPRISPGSRLAGYPGR